MNPAIKRFLGGLILLAVIILPTATHAALTRPLGLGSEGDDVTELQEALRSKGFFNYPVSTGFFGPTTQQAVVAYQRANGLEQVGNVGPQTRNLLNGGGGVLATGGTGTGGGTTISAGSGGNSTLAALLSLLSTLQAKLATLQGTSSSHSSGGGGGSSHSSGSSSSGGGKDTASDGGGSSGGGSGSSGDSGTGDSGSGDSGDNGGGDTTPPPVVVTPAPTLTLNSSVVSVTSGGSATLSWTSTNATSCTASNGWSGSQSATGSKTVTNISRATTFALTCTGAGGNIVKSVTVGITVVTTPPPTGPVSVSSTLTGSYPVYPGCQAPDTSYIRTIYFDANNGNDTTGDGTQSKPYKSLATFVGTHKAQGGDHLVLLPGYYGTLDMTHNANPELKNTTRWIWLDFQTGATMHNIAMDNESHWIITKPELTGLSTTFFTSGAGDSIIVADGNMYSVKDSTPWTANDWMTVASTGMSARNTTCVSFLRNELYNLNSGIFITTDNGVLPGYSVKALADHNEVKDYSGDGMRPIGSDITFSYNRVLSQRVSAADGDGNHDDAMQMYALNGAEYNNIVIDHNWIQDHYTPGIKFQADAQGISNFDGLVTHLQVTNNVILIGAYHALSEFGVQDSLIANNTVAGDNAAGPASPWIDIPVGKVASLIPYGTVVRNNVAPSIILDPVVIGVNNLVVTNPQAAYKKFDLNTLEFDLTPKPGGPLDGTGIGAFPTGTGDKTLSGSTGSNPPSCTLKTSVVTIQRGTSVTLTLASTGATSATIDNGVGTVAVNGTVNVTPLDDTGYSATVTGSGGTNSCVVKVVVNAPNLAIPANVSGPIISYSFEPSTIFGSLVKSLASYSTYGTLLGGAASVTGGHSGQALGTDITKGIKLDAYPASAYGITTAMTVAAWVYPTDLSQQRELIFSDGQVGSNNPAKELMSLGAAGFGNGPGVSFSDGTQYVNALAPRGVTLPPNQWSHVTGVLSGSNAYLYINGSLVGSGTTPSFKGLNQNSDSFAVGFDGNRQSYGMPGKIDDFRVYNRALSAAEVASLANGTLADAAVPGDIAPFTRQLALGATGSDVSALQGVLKTLGLYTYPTITGYLGQVTKTAVTNFQAQNQLAAVGEVGPQTRALLNSLISKLHLPF